MAGLINVVLVMVAAGAAPHTGLVIASGSIVAHDMVSLAWLLYNRRAMTEQELAGSRDPYKRQVIVGILNRLVVRRLGGIREAAHAEGLLRNDIDSIWDDRIPSRAYEVFGGIPRAELVNVGDSVPPELLAGLAGYTHREERRPSVSFMDRQVT